MVWVIRKLFLGVGSSLESHHSYSVRGGESERVVACVRREIEVCDATERAEGEEPHTCTM